MTGKVDFAKTTLNTKFGSFDFCCFSWGEHEEDNILCLKTQISGDEAPLLRIQSACYTAEIFRSTDCDCHGQLAASLRRISSEGGFLIYMLCDGRGAGLLTKIRGMELGRTDGLNTAQAYEHLGVPLDPRDYSRVVAALEHFGIDRVRLLTNNPRKIKALEEAGIEVSREPLELPATDESRPYLTAKRDFLGHMLDSLDEEGR